MTGTADLEAGVAGGVAPGADADVAPGGVDAEVARPPSLGREDLDRIFSVEEFEPLARERMHPSLYRYIRGWAGSGSG